MLVHIIADYGIGDLAFAEVAQRGLSSICLPPSNMGRGKKTGTF